MKNYSILYLTNNENTVELYEWLSKKENVILWKNKLTLVELEEIKPDIIISYNYSYIIGKDIIAFMNGNIVNLHISLLPWNRGSSPNFWSFWDDTPKGVTIHYIDEGLDTGDIIIQKECYFNVNEETFESSYSKLHNEITMLFQNNWNQIKKCEILPTRQKGNGSYHTLKDMKNIQELIEFSWSDKIKEVIDKKYFAGEKLCTSHTEHKR